LAGGDADYKRENGGKLEVAGKYSPEQTNQKKKKAYHAGEENVYNSLLGGGRKKGKLTQGGEQCTQTIDRSEKSQNLHLAENHAQPTSGQ